MTLTTTEVQVLQFMADGKTIFEACKVVGKQRTVVYRSLFETKLKYKFRTTQQMMAEALRKGLIQ